MTGCKCPLWTLLAALVLTACAGVHRSESSAISRDQQQRIEAVVDALDRGDVVAAEPILDSLISESAFARLPSGYRRALLLDAAAIAIGRDNDDQARELMRQAADADPNNSDTWLQLGNLQFQSDHYDAAAGHYARLISGWPQRLRDIDPRLLFRTVVLSDHDSAARLELMQALHDVQWAREQPDADFVLYALALARINAGDLEAARTIARQIDRPGELVAMRADRRFDTVIDPDNEQFDVVRGSQRYIERVTKLLDAHPERSDLMIELSLTLLETGANDAHLAFTQALFDRAKARSRSAFTEDELQWLPWLLDHRATALRRLGRLDQALDTMKLAENVARQGPDQVSQTLNLGAFLALLGRSEEALAVIEGADPERITSYGRMVQASIRHHAAVLSKDQAAADDALADLREHGDEAPLILLEALVQADRYDPAATILIEMLASPTDRADALHWVQEHRRAQPLPGSLDYQARRAALLQRADVREAIERVGRIEQQPLFSSSGKD